LSGVIRIFWRIAAGVFAVVVILLAVAIGLARLALVQLPEYRGQIEARVSEELGWPLRIAEIDARLGWRGPEFRFVDARVLTQDGTRTLIRASRGSLVFSSLALLRGEFQPASISLAGISLRVERNAEGLWHLSGKDGPLLGSAGAGEGTAALPRLSELRQSRLRLEDVQLELEDFARGIGPWLFQLDELELELADATLQVAAAGRLPRQLGRGVSFSLRVDGQDERGVPRDWSAGISVDGLDLPAVGATLQRADRFPHAGLVDGDVLLLSDAGGLARIAGELNARDLQLPTRSEADTAPEQDGYELLRAAFEWSRRERGWEARLRDLEVMRDGRHWGSPAASLLYELDGSVRRIEARAEQLYLEDLLPAAGWLPPAARAIVAELQPAGRITGLETHLDLPAGEGQQPDVFMSARFEQLSFAPRGRAPGVTMLSGRLDGDTYGGTVELDGAGSVVDMPWLFRAPIALDVGSVAAAWRRDEAGIHLDFPAIELGQGGTAVNARARLDVPADGSSPRLDLEGQARTDSLAAAPAYLPTGIMPPTVVAWLDRALLAGRVENASFELRGPTRAFPFRGDEGRFVAELDVAEGVLNFDPGWPDATGLDATVRFENEGLLAEVRSANLLGLAAGPARVSIPELRQGELEIVGEARGGLAQLREFALAAELLERAVGPGLRPATISAGRASADVRLSLPLRTLAETRARVDLRITNGAVSYAVLGEPVRGIDGLIRIDNTRVEGADIRGTIAGFPVTAQVSTGDDGAVRIDGGGPIDVPALSRVLRLPLERWATGQSDWQGHLLFPPPGVERPIAAEIHSSLEGVHIDLPEPLGKVADAPLGLRVSGRFPPGELVDFEFELDAALRILGRLDHSGPELELLEVPGAVEGGPPGLVFNGAVATVDAGAWLALAREPGGAGVRLQDLVAGGRLLVREIRAPMLKLGDALVELSRTEEAWRLRLEADNAAGTALVPFLLYGDEPLTARLDRLWLGHRAEEPGQASAREAPWFVHPALVPPLDLEIDDVRLGNVRIGSVSARILHEGDGFELIGLEGVGESFMFQAEGRSRLSDTVDESRLALSIRSDNVGATLGYLGFRRSMEAREADVQLDTSWQGGLRSDWLAAIDGTASIEIGPGKLVGVEPGAGRVLGLLSIQALPRRLALDFKDVFGEGTAFDSIRGSFRIIGGDAYTDNFVMRGPSADVVVFGRAGLVARDYDQTAVIGADIGRTVPVAGAVVGGPAVGAALLLLSEVLRKPLQAQVTYRLTGPWDNPVVERIGAGQAPARPVPPEGPLPGPGEG
jgi:uncharacterized protein (TIGR02099 family)